jgi:heat shock protein HslJ
MGYYKYMKKFIIGGVIIIALLVAGFYILNAYIYNEKQVDTNTPSVSTTTSVTSNPNKPLEPYDAKRLESKSWTWIAVTYNDGTVISPKENLPFSITFKNDGTFTATTDCNSLGGKFTAAEGAIKFSEMYSTRMLCEGSQEEDFKKVLSRAAGYLFTERGELVLDIERDTGSAVFK